MQMCHNCWKRYEDCGCRTGDFHEEPDVKPESEIARLTRERDALQATVGSLQSTVQNLREAILKAVAEKKEAVERLIEMQTTESERIKQLEATVEKCRAAQKRVMDKCEQYWNEEPPKGPEFRAMLEYMHIQLRLTAERAKGGGDA